MGELAAEVLAHFLLREGSAFTGAHSGAELLAVALVGDADDLHLGDIGPPH